MITTVEGFRAFDALGTFQDKPDTLIEAELEQVESMFSGLLEGRGYPAAILAGSPAYVRAVFKAARVELLGINGANPLDPGHAHWILERDRAVAWIEKVARGAANLGPGATARTPTGTAMIYGANNDLGDPEDRGW